MGKIVRPMEGVVCYFEPRTGAGVLLTHHIADPLKRSLRWRAEAATDPAFPEGENDPHFAEEMDMSFTAARAKLIYYRWSDAYSLVEPFDIHREGFTRVVLSMDYGDHTYCSFFAQHPRTQQSVGFDELYWYKQPIPAMQADIYAKLAELRGLKIGEFMANEVVEDICGDPRGAGLARAFAEGDLPIVARTKSFDSTASMSDHLTGWAKVNTALAPGFWHCGHRQRPMRSDGTEGTAGKCRFCGKQPIKAVPLLVFMRGKMPYLESTMPELEKQESRPDEEESTKEKRGQPDHAGDTVRYYEMRTQRLEPKLAERDILKMPVGNLTLAERCKRINLETYEKQQKEKDRGERDDNGYRVTARGGDDDLEIRDAEDIIRRQTVGTRFYEEDDD